MRTASATGTHEAACAPHYWKMPCSLLTRYINTCAANSRLPYITNIRCRLRRAHRLPSPTPWARQIAGRNPRGDSARPDSFRRCHASIERRWANTGRCHRRRFSRFALFCADGCHRLSRWLATAGRMSKFLLGRNGRPRTFLFQGYSHSLLATITLHFPYE